MTRSDSRRGMVLFTVLWSISLLSALETAAGVVQTSSDAPLTEAETTVTLGTGAVRARLNDEGGRIDIGKAPVEVLASMFRFVGVPEAAAGKVAQRIVER